MTCIDINAKTLTLVARFAVCLCLAVYCDAGAEQAFVDVDGESLSGAQDALGNLAFKGVPYAEPPVGELRWQKPQPLQTKQAERDATEFAPACMQSMRILEWYRGLAETFGASPDVFGDLVTSEDCLYLNIWTPDLHPAAPLPVMVYVHGGSNVSGWSYEPNYQGSVLAGQGVVVVSIAYRLGVFGFFSHPEAADANFGLWDQLAALEWVQRHIARFGGDPNHVTLFGESAGAQDALALLTSSRAQGLFQRAILQSTAGFGIGSKSEPSLADERGRGMATAALFGYEGAGSLDKLRQVPAAILLRTYEDAMAGYYHSPAIDNALLREPVWRAIVADHLAKIPIIIGTNADEWYASTPADAGPETVRERIAASAYLNSPLALQVIEPEGDPREALDRIDSAEFMLCPSQSLAARLTARRGNAWVYYFARIRDGAAGATVRAYHGAELPYVFGTHDPWMVTTEADLRLSRQMMAYWTRFAATGNPNADDLPHWSPFAEADGPVMVFADETAESPPQEAVLCSIFRQSLAQVD